MQRRSKRSKKPSIKIGENRCFLSDEWYPYSDLYSLDGIAHPKSNAFMVSYLLDSCVWFLVSTFGLNEVWVKHTAIYMHNNMCLGFSCYFVIVQFADSNIFLQIQKSYLKVFFWQIKYLHQNTIKNILIKAWVIKFSLCTWKRQNQTKVFFYVLHCNLIFRHALFVFFNR